MTKKDFVIYRYLSNEPILVAVAREYIPKIRHVISQFGSLGQAPHDWEVRGIFIKPAEEGDFDPNAPQNEVLVANLREY